MNASSFWDFSLPYSLQFLWLQIEIRKLLNYISSSLFLFLVLIFNNQHQASAFLNRFTLLHQEYIEFQKFGLRNNVAQLCILKVSRALAYVYVHLHFLSSFFVITSPTFRFTSFKLYLLEQLVLHFKHSLSCYIRKISVLKWPFSLIFWYASA